MAGWLGLVRSGALVAGTGGGGARRTQGGARASAPHVTMNARRYSESVSGSVLARRRRTGSSAQRVELAVVSSLGIDVSAV